MTDTFMPPLQIQPPTAPPGEAPQGAPYTQGLDPMALQMLIQALRKESGPQQQSPDQAAPLSAFSTPLGVAGQAATMLGKSWKDAHPDDYNEKGQRKGPGLLSRMFSGGPVGKWDTTVTPGE